MSHPPPSPNQHPGPPYWGPGGPPPPPQPRKKPWYRKTWVIAIASLLFGIGIGSAGAEDDTTPSEAASALSESPSTVMVTTTKPASAPSTVRVTTTKPAPAPPTVRVTTTEPAPAPSTVTVTRRGFVAPKPAQQAPAPATNCASGYSPCLPVVSDLNCDDIAFTVQVTGGDQYGLDADGDGYGCDS